MNSEQKYYILDRPDPTKEFLAARQVALHMLRHQFNLKGGRVSNEHEDFRMIRADLTYPTFDHISFGYKNQVFSVFIDFIDEQQNSLTPRRYIEKLINVANDNNLVPCLFKIRLSDMQPLADGWNLFHAVNKMPVVPEEIAGSNPVKMSEWEYNNWAINIVMKDLGEKILSYCDAPGIFPQIWFENSQGERCWILVKHSVFPNVAEMEELFVPPQPIQCYNGFFAGVSFCYADEGHPEKQLFRNSPAFVRYDGLQELWKKSVTGIGIYN